MNPNAHPPEAQPEAEPIEAFMDDCAVRGVDWKVELFGYQRRCARCGAIGESELCAYCDEREDPELFDEFTGPMRREGA